MILSVPVSVLSCFAVLRQSLAASLVLLTVAGFMTLADMSVGYAADGDYFSAFPELPIPPNMQEDADNAVRFDQPEGRVITLQASGAVSPSDIVDFYDKTMPALGWTRHSLDTSGVSIDESGSKPLRKAYFTRDKELLFFEINGLGNGQARMNVLLRPR